MVRTLTPSEVAHEALLFRRIVTAARSKADGGATDVAISDLMAARLSYYGYL